MKKRKDYVFINQDPNNFILNEDVVSLTEFEASLIKLYLSCIGYGSLIPLDEYNELKKL